MKLVFENIHIHNFLSIGDIELDLTNRSYTLVEGINANPGDGALSNGSGKSSLWNAICWCLTGETIQGLKSNIPNIHGEDGCYVKLSMHVDNDSYEITRYRAYSTINNDLKIIINGEDKSGKGLRESEALLEQYLPDITPELIGNVILLGQGLPHKFSDNTPAGRKELLEQLSKSDFMIQDIKNRLAIRTTDLDNKLRTLEDNGLTITTKLNMVTNQLELSNNELNALSNTLNKETVDQAETNKLYLCNRINELNEIINNLDTYINDYRNNSTVKLNNLNTQLQNVGVKYAAIIESAQANYFNLSSEAKLLTQELITLESIKDVCPTCGQKLPNVHKVDTSDKKLKLNSLNESVGAAQVAYLSIKNKQADEEELIKKAINEENIIATNEINTKMTELQAAQTELSKCNQSLKTAEELLIKYKAELDNFEHNKERLINNIKELNKQIDELNKSINSNQTDIDRTKEHLDVLAKINSLIKRDFRGLLLTNVIDFINNKAKEYCKYVFNTDNISIYLDGNNLNIMYDQKDYANLSGGEKQKVDIVTQFAIRDMMCKYLGFSSNILVIDEIFDALDATGVTGVLNLINNILTDVDSLFIISHHASELDIPYDSKISIIKDENGVSKLN